MWLLMLFLVAGPVIIGLGVREAAHQRRLRRAGIRTEGRVARYRGERHQGSTLFYPVINFVDTRGDSHEFEAHVSGVGSLPVGGPAPVRYLPGAPGTARLDLSPQRFWSLVIPFVVGTAFTVAGVWGLTTGR